MSQTKFTPGPWEAGRPDMATIVDGVDSKWIYAGDQYAAVASGRIAGSWDEVMANAHLIAAAPDLYLCLERLLREAMSRPDFIDPETETFCRDALAKARGEA